MHMFFNKILKHQKKEEVQMDKPQETKELSPTAEKLYKLTGFLPTEVEDILNDQAGQDTLEFLIKWAELTRKSLQANKEIMFNCLTMDMEGYVLCRFCAEGIPNWKEEDAREHSSTCPIELVSSVLIEVQQMLQLVTESIPQN